VYLGPVEAMEYALGSAYDEAVALVPVFFTRDDGTAQLAKSLLQGEGIAFLALHDSALDDLSALQWPIEFQVSEEDADRATSLLMELAQQPFGWTPDRAD
jgi:hypothetical protein